MVPNPSINSLRLVEEEFSRSALPLNDQTKNYIMFDVSPVYGSF